MSAFELSLLVRASPRLTKPRICKSSPPTRSQHSSDTPRLCPATSVLTATTQIAVRGDALVVGKAASALPNHLEGSLAPVEGSKMGEEVEKSHDKLDCRINAVSIGDGGKKATKGQAASLSSVLGDACGGLSSQLHSRAAVGVASTFDSQDSAQVARGCSPQVSSQDLICSGKGMSKDMGKPDTDKKDQEGKDEKDKNCREKDKADLSGSCKRETKENVKGSEGHVSTVSTSDSGRSVEKPIDVVCVVCDPVERSPGSPRSGSLLQLSEKQPLQKEESVASRSSALDGSCHRGEHVEVITEKALALVQRGSAVQARTSTTALDAESFQDIIGKQPALPAVLDATDRRGELSLTGVSSKEGACNGSEAEGGSAKWAKHESRQSSAKGKEKSESKEAKKAKAYKQKKRPSPSDSSSDFCLSDSDVSPTQSSGTPSDGINGADSSRRASAHAHTDKELRPQVRFV